MLLLVMLTARRVGEVLAATWQEFDLNAEVPVWTIPAARAKMGRSHRVPLGAPALALLRAARRPDGKPTDLAFHGLVRGRKLTDSTVRNMLRKVSLPDADTHGLRSTFRNWCAEQTSYPREVAELALAHLVGTDVERASFRSISSTSGRS